MIDALLGLNHPLEIELILLGMLRVLRTFGDIMPHVYTCVELSESVSLIGYLSTFARVLNGVMTCCHVSKNGESFGSLQLGSFGPYMICNL